jgi:hypothetical protein
MTTARMILLAQICLAGSIASPAHAFLDPYVRVGFGGNQVRMTEANNAIETAVDWARTGGLPVTPGKVGAGYGPAASAGLWLVPFLRVGATYAHQRSKVPHEYTQPGFLYADHYEFSMQEIGLEAAVRIPRLAGFTFGGNVAEGRAEMTESFALENVHGLYYEDVVAERSCRTYAAFVAFDQTAENGLAGFLQVGYHWREVGPMSGYHEIDDNGTVTRTSVETVPTDYSGWSVRVGAGFDLNW